MRVAGARGEERERPVKGRGEVQPARSSGKNVGTGRISCLICTRPSFGRDGVDRFPMDSPFAPDLLKLSILPPLPVHYPSSMHNLQVYYSKINNSKKGRRQLRLTTEATFGQQVTGATAFFLDAVAPMVGTRLHIIASHVTREDWVAIWVVVVMGCHTRSWASLEAD